MKEARKKLRIWLISVVALAVIIGCIYYFNDMKSKESISDGTLVRAEDIAENTEAVGNAADAPAVPAEGVAYHVGE